MERNENRKRLIMGVYYCGRPLAISKVRRNVANESLDDEEQQHCDICKARVD
jgi:hypothetical protein